LHIDMEESALDQRHADVRIEFAVARAEFAQSSATRAHAEQLAAISATLAEARAFPEVFLGSAIVAPSEAVEFAERAAVADLATRLLLSEVTVRAQGHQADTLMLRMPRLWAAFREGDVSSANAIVATEIVLTLEQPEQWEAFEAAVLVAAQNLPPARFRNRARAARERVTPEQLAERHRRAADERRVWMESGLDGMAWLTAYLPADRALLAMTNIECAAESLFGQPDETRTLAQLKADVASDLLGGILGAESGPASLTVSVTVPVLTLLGLSEDPGSLEGYGPIDADTARELARHAPSFTRILTHPITGTILDYDRGTYRVPADLARRVQDRDKCCTFTGCGRLAKNCDIDHTVAWEDGGTTSLSNLALLCRNHHRLKHKTGWKVDDVDLDGHTRRRKWTSPTGHITYVDPPF
jgi:hypothetical protein